MTEVTAMALDGRILRARAKREQTRGKILDTARELFAERGYAAVAIDDILKRADIARGTFYLHFDSKVSMVGALLDDLVAKLTDAIVPVDTKANHNTELKGNFTRVVDTLSEHQDVAKLLLTAQEPELAEKAEAFTKHAITMIKGALKAGKKMGLLTNVDIDTAASIAFGGIREVALRRLFGRRLSAQQRSQLAAETLAILMGGLLSN